MPSGSVGGTIVKKKKKKKQLCGTKILQNLESHLRNFLVTVVEKPSRCLPCIEGFREVRPDKRKSMLESTQVGDWALGLCTCSVIYSL